MRTEAKASGWLQSTVTTMHILSMRHALIMLRKFYFSSSVVSCTFSAHVRAIRVFNVQASSSLPRQPLCQISFLW